MPASGFRWQGQDGRLSTGWPAQIAGSLLFLGVFLRMFLEQISIWFRRLSEVTHSPQCRWVLFSLLRATWKKWWRKVNPLSLPEWECPSFPSLGHQSSCFLGLWTLGLLSEALWFSGLWTWTELYHLVFLGVQLVDGGWWDVISVTTLANSYNKFPFI